ncbi:unnamed protein product, partial [Owenia fusiformis]
YVKHQAMSSMYYRTQREAAKTKTYGHQKCNRAQIKAITERLTRHTVQTHNNHQEINNDLPSPPRPISAPCHKALRHKTIQPDNRRVDEDTLRRIMRRITQPTFSVLVAKGAIKAAPPQRKLERPRTAVERRKAMSSIQRPTTASSKKRLGSPWNYEDDYVSDHDSDYEYGEYNVRTREELEPMVDQWVTPIKSHGTPVCGRLGPTSAPNLYKDKTMPLVSGLVRTNRVDEITARLFTPTKSIPITRCRNSERSH